MTGVPIKVWRKELVYVSMILFISAALLHICIRIFLVIKLGRKEFLTKTSLLSLTLVCAFAALIMFYTRMVSHIKDQFHPAICLLFNILIVSLLWYLLTTNKDAMEMVKKKIKRYKIRYAPSENNNRCKSKQIVETGPRKRDNIKCMGVRNEELQEDEGETSLTWVGIVKIVNFDN